MEAVLLAWAGMNLMMLTSENCIRGILAWTGMNLFNYNDILFVYGISRIGVGGDSNLMRELFQEPLWRISCMSGSEPHIIQNGMKGI